ncbi:TauD/TfdA dioxygenase family protein [Rhodococcus sp. SJ-2]
MSEVVVTPPPARFRMGPLVADRNAPGFDPQPYTAFTLSGLTPTIGAEVSGIDLGADLDDQVVSQIHRALLEWKVLFFRDQNMGREAQRRLALKFGEIEHHPFFKYAQPFQTAEDVATLKKGENSPGYENVWHNDVTFLKNPSKMAILRAVEVPELGGDTLWADMGAAYDTLPEDLRARVDGLTAEHDWIESFGVSMDAPAIRAARVEYPPVTHPIVRTIPETGRRVLFVNSIFTQRINAVGEQASKEILNQIYAHCTRPDFQVRLKWRSGTVAMWDNRACQHYAVNDYYPKPREMDRISIVGDIPAGISASPTN